MAWYWPAGPVCTVMLLGCSLLSKVPSVVVMVTAFSVVLDSFPLILTSVIPSALIPVAGSVLTERTFSFVKAATWKDVSVR